MRLGNEFLHRVLTAQGIPHEYRLVPDEGHFPVAPERFLATFAFIGRALGHGGGDSQAGPYGRRLSSPALNVSVGHGTGHPPLLCFAPTPISPDRLRVLGRP